MAGTEAVGGVLVAKTSEHHILNNDILFLVLLEASRGSKEGKGLQELPALYVMKRLFSSQVSEAESILLVGEGWNE